MYNNYSLLLKEVSAINSSTREYDDIQFKIILHNKDNDIKISLFESLEFKADYNNKVADDIFIHFNMGLGDYTYDVLPYKNNTEITVIKSFNNTPYENITYKAVLLDTSVNSKGVQSNLTKDILNKASLIRVSFQLVEKNVEVIRTINVDGIYRSTTVKNAIVPIINNAVKNISINGEKLNSLLNMVEPDNTKVYNTIVIPTGTALTNLVTFIQDTKYGIYVGDIGFYIKSIRESLMNYKNCFFIYPLYTRKEDQYDSLFIYHADSKLNKASNNTYEYINKTLKIISSEVTIVEKGERDFINDGNHVAYGNMENIYNYNSTVTNDKISYTKKTQLGNDKISTEDGLSNETYIGNIDNLCKYYSNLSNKNMSLYQFKWQFSNHRHLLPGMNVTVFYQVDKDIKKLQGILQGYYSIYNQALKNEMTILMIKLKEVTDE